MVPFSGVRLGRFGVEGKKNSLLWGKGAGEQSSEREKFRVSKDGAGSKEELGSLVFTHGLNIFSEFFLGTSPVWTVYIDECT